MGVGGGGGDRKQHFSAILMFASTRLRVLLLRIVLFFSHFDHKSEQYSKVSW